MFNIRKLTFGAVIIAWSLLAGLSSGQAQTKALTVNPATTFQTIEGIGGATAFYAGWIRDHPFKMEVYSNAFAGLNISMLRLGDWYRYQTPIIGFDTANSDIVSNANRVLGHPVPVFMSSWAPPAFLKSNGQVGNGGTLVTTNGGFAYTNFAQYWYDSLQAYQSNGVTPTWISIQNEPDWAASYDSCVFHPNEDTVNGTNYASYSKALDAVFQRLTKMPSPPKILAPEVVGLGFNDVQNYAAPMHSNSFYGVTHHLYGGSTDGSPAGYIPAFKALATVFPGKPKFMTEFGYSNMIDAASLIHYEMTVEQVSGFNFWSLIWPAGGTGLVQIENPYDGTRASWTNAPPGTASEAHGWWLAPSYWGMKHFSYFITPGFKRVSATSADTNVLASAYLSPDGLRLVTVLINQKSNASSTLTPSFGSFPIFVSGVYQTAGTNYFESLGAVGSQLTLPPASLTTVVLDKFVSVGAAANPSPANGQSNVALGAILSWSSGNNAATHALYFGTTSNAVASATTASPQFLGFFTNSSFTPALSGGITYFWRVDEFAGVNTNTGSVWSFATAPPPALLHRYSFSETSGTTVADSIGGPGWNGTLPNGGTFANGQLMLSSASSQYVSLPAGIVGGLSNFTIEAWVKFNSIASWNRIFDFGNSTTTYMFLTPQNGTGGKLHFAISTNGAGGEQPINTTMAISSGVSYHFAVTMNGNTGMLYLNGAPIGTNTITLKPSSIGVTLNNYIGKSQYPDPYLNGSLDEFRIYTVALSPAEIAATDALGPSQTLSTNSPTISMSATSSNLVLTWPLASAGFKLQARTNLQSGNWVTITSPAPQIIAGQWQITLPRSTSSSPAFYQLIK